MAAIARVAHLDELEAMHVAGVNWLLPKAFAGDPLTREWAQTDSDLDAVRTHPRRPR